MDAKRPPVAGSDSKSAPAIGLDAKKAPKKKSLAEYAEMDGKLLQVWARPRKEDLSFISD